MRVWAATDIGRVRQENQDSFAYSVAQDGASAVCVVCDGMGGVSGGKLASELASSAFVAEFGKLTVRSFNSRRLPEYLIKAADSANQQVYRRSLDEPQYKGMGTTLVAAVLSGESIGIVNVGDSRAYRIGAGGISQITHDHSVVEGLVDMGEITREQAKHHPRKNLITRAIGTEKRVTPDVFEPGADRGEFILLCTDGLTNVVDDSEILDIVRCGAVEEACDRLIDAALTRGAPDNVTVALIEV